MRCPDCNKFVSMESGDPEFNSCDAEVSDGSILVTASVRSVRNCADCGTELKALDIDLEETVEVDESWEGYKELTEAQRGRIKNTLRECGVDAEEGSTSMEEGGGGRYKKNMIATIVEVELSFEHEGMKLKKSVELRSENAASEFEEQV